MIYKQKMIWRELAVLFDGVLSQQSGLSLDMNRVDPQYKEPKLAELAWVKSINGAVCKILRAFDAHAPAPEKAIAATSADESIPTQPTQPAEQTRVEKTIEIPFDEKMRPVPLFEVQPAKINSKSFFGSLNWKRNDANAPYCTELSQELIEEESAAPGTQESSEAGQFFQKAIPWGGRTKDPLEMKSLRKGVEFASYKNMHAVATMTAIQKSQAGRKQATRFEGEGDADSAKNFFTNLTWKRS